MRVLAVDVILNRSRPPSFSLYKVPCQILTRWGGKEKLDGRNWPSLPYFFFFFFLFSLTFEIAVEKMFEESREKKGQTFHILKLLFLKKNLPICIQPYTVRYIVAHECCFVCSTRDVSLT